MKAHLNPIVAAALLCAAYPAVSLADSTKFPLKGDLKTGYASALAGNPTVIVAASTAPSTAAMSRKVFVVQKLCCATSGTQTTVQLWAGTGPSFPVFLQANTFITGCIDYSPGFVVPEGLDLMVQGTTQDLTCSVTGIVARKK